MTRIDVGGPWFEDLKVGMVFDGVPPMTLTAGLAAQHAAICGDRMRLPMDASLCEDVTGDERLLAHPLLVCNVAIGASTEASQRVRANLFYRRLMLLRAPRIGDTLRTRTEIVGLRQNSRKPGRPATGLVGMRITVEDQLDRKVMDFWRAPMIPLREPDSDTGHQDDLSAIPAEIDLADVQAAVPSEWRLDRFRARVPGLRFDELVPGTEFEIEGRDTVTSAPELVRLTLNMASTHVDSDAGLYGRRLVYGGHTIAMAAGQVERAIPLVSIIAWRSCDHTGPVFEGDRLRTDVTVEAIHPLAEGGLVDLRAITFAHRASGEQIGPEPVLDWRFVALVA